MASKLSPSRLIMAFPLPVLSIVIITTAMSLIPFCIMLRILEFVVQVLFTTRTNEERTGPPPPPQLDGQGRAQARTRQLGRLAVGILADLERIQEAINREGLEIVEKMEELELMMEEGVPAR
ncbi:hypothetical protein PG993_004336 [Apiospora rasikravindrae]|uniref:Uncharacterized protein n=1 Tax=Apiospora rasikravindrae TaxID=990691 RepID=A0ABR1TCI5_9PEZI